MRNFKILTLICSLIICIFLAEIVARLYYFNKLTTNRLILSRNPDLIYEHRPSILFTNTYGIKTKYNSLGFSGEEIIAKKAGTLRILGIGDSIMDAPYLNEDKKFLHIIAQELKEATGKIIEVINAAVGGYNTWQELAMIKEKGLAIKPDLIIVSICLNDFNSSKPILNKMLFSNRIGENYRDGSKARYFNSVYQRSDLYKFIYDFFSNSKRKMYTKEGFLSYAKSYDIGITNEEFRKWRYPFNQMMDLAQSNKIEILFVIFPLQGQVINREMFSCKDLSDFFVQNKAHCIDLIGNFSIADTEGKALYRERDIIHPNEYGHQLAALYITKYLLDNKMLK